MDIVDIIASVLVALILIFIIISLQRSNKKLKSKIEQEKKKMLVYRQGFDKLNMINPRQKDLDSLDKLARDFFKERDNLSYSFTYNQLAEEFRKSGKNEKASFCIKMSNLLFSGKEIKTGEIREAMEIFSNILEEINIFKEI